jgi:hypothetical protein
MDLVSGFEIPDSYMFRPDSQSARFKIGADRLQICIRAARMAILRSGARRQRFLLTAVVCTPAICLFGSFGAYCDKKNPLYIIKKRFYYAFGYTK